MYACKCAERKTDVKIRVETEERGSERRWRDGACVKKERESSRSL